jgi:L-asparaginase/Glu-tRNA(Gln) amidotransferase subunit D
VLHGTDTVAYTASSLSFMLENLNKPVILTGSQIPILELKTDAVDNLLGALLIAGQYQIPEVAIFFGNKLLRGNRTTKVSTIKIVAFESPNLGPLGEVGVNF